MHLLQRANGNVMCGLDAPWILRRNCEAEIFAAAEVVCFVGHALAQRAGARRMKGEAQKLYCDAGRAIRLCSSIQHGAYVMASYKKVCENCKKIRAR